MITQSELIELCWVVPLTFGGIWMVCRGVRLAIVNGRTHDDN